MGHAEQTHVAAERAILGYLINDHSPLDWLTLEPEYFTDPRNRHLYTALVRLRDTETPADLVTVEDELTRSGSLAAVPLTYLAALEPSLRSRLEFHAAILARKNLTRNILDAVRRVEAENTLGTDGFALLDVLTELTSRLAAPVGHETVSIGEAVTQEYRLILDDMEALSRGDRIDVGVPTGIKILDENTGGVPFGVPTVIGARPAVGKSALALAIADHATAHGYGTEFISYEDRAPGFAQRSLGSYAGVDVSHIRARNLSKRELMLLGKAADELKGRNNLKIEHGHGMTVTNLCRLVLSRMQANKTRLVIVDYIQLMPPPNHRCKDKNAEVEANMETLSTFCGKHNIALIVLSQLNRDCEGRTPPRPTLRDFRASGAIEQCGKLILGLMKLNEEELEIGVLKNHQGPQARFSVGFDRRFCRFKQAGR